jgi:aryl-alcohol dehydrogenase-like predicted oxidoreductase
MEFRYLGNSGLRVSEISYGNWITHASQVAEDTAISCVNAALEAGVSTFDTADVYANTEAEVVLGKALKGQRRESLEIFTKVYWPTGPRKHNDSGLSRKHIMESCNASLKRLGTDYVDLYQAHRFDVKTPLEETLIAFDDLVRQGKVLYIGFSEWTADQIKEAVKIANDLGLTKFISSQPQYSMLWRVIESKVDPVCKSNGISHIVWSPIAQGVLTGKYLPGQPVPADSRAASHEGGSVTDRFLKDEILAAVQNLKPIAADCGLTMAQLAVAWVLQNENVASAIVGASKPAQITEAAKASGVKLTGDVMKAIDKALGDVVATDPKLTVSPDDRPVW